VWLWAVVISEPRHVLWEHSLVACFFFIAAGMLLSFARLAVERRPPAWLAGRLGNADLWLVAALAIWLYIFTNYHLLPLVTIATFLTVGACVLPLRQGRLVRLLDFKPLAVVGVASYSLYVWHLPLEDFITGYDGRTGEGLFQPFVLAIPVCIAVALVSYRLIEDPFLRLRKRWSPASAPMR
jgi:peptidoglycan/LPS O-acetylase OafA/YrhL